MIKCAFSSLYQRKLNSYIWILSHFVLEWQHDVLDARTTQHHNIYIAVI